MTLGRRKTDRRLPLVKPRDHQRLWRLVEGGVLDAFKSHPDYLTAKGQSSAIQSVTKRVVGQLVGYAKQAQVRGRPIKEAGGSGVSAVERGADGAAGRRLPLPPRTRLPDLYQALCGDL